MCLFVCGETPECPVLWYSSTAGLPLDITPAPTNPKTGSGSDHPGGRSPQSHCSISPSVLKLSHTTRYLTARPRYFNLNLRWDINRLQLLLLAEQAATAAATAAADRVFTPAAAAGHIAPITSHGHEYQLQALRCEVVQLQQRLKAAVSDAQRSHSLGIVHTTSSGDHQRRGDCQGNRRHSTSKRQLRSQRTLKGGAHTLTAGSTHPSCQEQPP